jgi:hypothetical protein
MWKRCRYWFLLIALIGIALAVYFEPTRCVRGWLWGEAFFEGRPTSFWRGVIERDLRTAPQAEVWEALNPPPRSKFWEYVDDCKNWAGFESRVYSSLELVNYARAQDANACQVLEALTQDENRNVAGLARDALEKQRQQAEEERPMEPDNIFTRIGRKIGDDGFWAELIVKHNLKNPPDQR